MNEGNQAGNMGNDQSTQNDKMFTQDEVNKIVQARVSKVKDQAGKNANAEYESKIKELEAREHRLTVLEVLHEKSMDPELADVIQCTDKKDLEYKLSILDRIYSRKYKTDPEQAANSKPGFHKVGGGQSGRRLTGDAVRKAMGMDY